MKLVSFSVSNYRSITKAHKISVSDKTILIGKNNEGKSNLLKALNVAMTILERHSSNLTYRTGLSYNRIRPRENSYNLERDFPISLQNKKIKNTVIKLEFELTEKENNEFNKTMKSNINCFLPIEITVSERNIKEKIKVSKSIKTASTLNENPKEVAAFIAERIVFNYIPAIRTDQEAIDVVSRMLVQRLEELENNPEYKDALGKIREIQTPVLKELSNTIKKSLKEFLPIREVSIELPDNKQRAFLRHNFDIIIDDGSPTSIAFKGDGVKSLAALGLLKDKKKSSGSSIIAIEEPESHLHPGALHQLNSIITDISKENQVILTTHNPLFVERDNISSNIIVENGKATPAKKIKEIRDVLGIKVSDNLVNANYVLLVEGPNDVISLKALLKDLSNKLKKQINNNMLMIVSIGGANKLSYHLSLLKDTLCKYHCFLDNDEAGQLAYESAVENGLLSVKSNTFINYKGLTEAEFEDCINLNLYKEKIRKEMGVNLDCDIFKNTQVKWSQKVEEILADQGKNCDNNVAIIKYFVAKCVEEDPANALCSYRRNSIDFLVKNLEELIKS